MVKIKKSIKYIILLSIIALFLSMTYVSAENVTISDNDINADNINIETQDVTMYYKNGSRLNVELSNSDDNPISNNNVTIAINGKNYTKTTDSDGKTSLAINLNPGKYLANITFLGNDKYLNTNTTANIDVLSTIIAKNMTKYYKSNSQFEAKILDGKGNPLTNENVTFNINGVFYNRTTNQNGIAKLNINLNPGEYIITVLNPNDRLLKSYNVRVRSSINASDLSKIYKDNNQYWATFFYENGELLKNTNVTFNINGVTYTRKTNNNGNAKLNINLNPGKYIITAYNPINNEAHSNNIQVYDFSDTKLTSENKVFKENEEVIIKTTLTNRFNLAVPNKNITLNIGNNEYKTLTDENGEAKFNIGLAQGNYTLKYAFSGDENYGASSAENSLEIFNGIKTEITSNSKTLFYDELFNITLKDEKGNPLVNKTVYFEIDSDILSEKTDKNGIASFDVSDYIGDYDIKYYFNESGYEYSKELSHLSVIRVNNTKITPLTFELIEGEKEKLFVKLTCGYITLSNRTIILTINGKEYEKTTNSEGIANITINLPANKYDISYLFKGDSRLNNCTNSSTLNVYKVLPTKITPLTKENIYKDSKVYYKVLLSSESGAPINAKEITLTMGQYQYTSFTKNDGIAEFNIIKDLDIGNYTISTKFRGDELYGESNAESEVKINAPIGNGYGYWAIGYSMNNINLSSLASKGTTDILINYYAITLYGLENFTAWVKQAGEYNIRVHVWMQVVYKDGVWRALEYLNGTFKYDLIESIVDEAKSYANISGVAGIHFDYLRYGGTAYNFASAAESINYFVYRAMTEAKKINPNIILTAALMPEPDRMLYIDGQDVPTLSKYLDALIPMVYKGNYNKDTAWIGEMTQRFVEMSNGAPVWTGLQGYVSDDDETPLSYDELFNDAQTALNSNANGIIPFRWGVTNFLNFNDLTTL